MRGLLLFLLLGAIAVAVALFARINVGYVLFVAPPYRLELSLNAFLVLAVAAFALGYAVARFAARLGRLPAEVRAHRKAQQVARARAKQDAALVGLLEGRFGRARAAAEEALAIPHSSGLAALIAARAAMETREFDVAEGFLSRPDAQVPSLAVPRMMLEAEIALERGRGGDALARLAALKGEAGAHTAALRLELRALALAGRHAEVPPIVDQLEKRKVYDRQQAELLRAVAHADALRGLATDAAGLRAYWHRLPDAERTNPRVAHAAARSFLLLGGDREAAEIAREEPRAGLGSGARGAVRAVPIARRQAAARARRALADASQPGRDAARRARTPVRARAALGQGADLLRGEPGTRRRLAHARGAGRDACPPRSRRRGQRAPRRGAEARARGARARRGAPVTASGGAGIDNQRLSKDLNNSI